MTNLSRTCGDIQDSIAQQMTEHLNRAVEELLEGGMRVMGKKTRLPLLKLIEVVQSRYLHSASLFLKRHYPWISATDVSLCCCSQSQESEQAVCDEVKKLMGQVNLSLDAIAGLSVTAPRTSSLISVFERIVKQLSPYALHQLEKYVEWQKQKNEESVSESDAKLAVIDQAWKAYCISHGVDPLVQGEKSKKLKQPLTWKGLFIATYFRLHCLKLKPKGDCNQLPALALFLDNREMLEDCGAMDLVG